MRIDYMPTHEAKLSRKQQEIKERIDYWLNLAEELISEKGYSGFQLVDIAAHSGFSTGLVYKQFHTKETITIMLAIRFFEKWHALLSKALDMDAPGRARLFALHMGYSMLAKTYPSAYRCLYIAATSEYKSKVNEDLFQEYENCINIVIDRLTAIVESSITRGELSLPKQFESAREFATTFWSSHHGVASLSLSEITVGREVAEAYYKFMRLAWDCMEWHPLSTAAEHLPLCEAATTKLLAKDFVERRVNTNQNRNFITPQSL